MCDHCTEAPVADASGIPVYDAQAIETKWQAVWAEQRRL